MSTVSAAANWEYGADGEVRLTGAWTLLLEPERRWRLMRELAGIASTQLRWNLDGVVALDSAGARLLWEVWGRRLPERLACRADHMHWFRWLATLQIPEPLPPLRLADRWVRAGSHVLRFVRGVGGVLLLIGQLLLDVGYCVRHPRVIPWKEITATIHHVGAMSMLLLGCVGFLIGVVMTIQLGMALSQFGAAMMIVGTMGLAVLRELGPVVCGLILAGRSGSAMTSGIAAMHLTGEYDALRAFGPKPSLRLALPRVVGALISVPLLVVWTDFTALLGGAVTAQADLGVGWRLFLAELPAQVQIVNFWIGLAKGALFGLTIAVVGCYFGMTASPDTDGLSRNTTLSVVTSLTLILVFDASSGALLTHVGLL
ncbi:MAG TPA: ABC transporter permease [Castellaniella sp.]|uniref:MlaE family ABC transporter permease n=1 Tax=Castellaniella sp. TaxID=1955812 RepID=UPI002EF285D7